VSDLVTPDSAMTMLKAAPDLIFPFRVSGGIELNRDPRPRPLPLATRQRQSGP
jgi:hypothetical protein